MSSLKENNFMVVLSSDCFNENDLKSNALDNISIKIDLPSLDKRGLVERMELVQGCFKKEARKITTGLKSLSYVEVIDGLEEGENVVIPEHDNGFGGLI